MQVGKFYKIVYKDEDYTKIARGPLINDELHLIEIKDIKKGKITIGKSTITSAVEVENEVNL